MNNNTPFERTLENINTGKGFSPDMLTGAYLFGLKGMFLVAFGLYVLFAVVVIRQVYLMEQTINTPLHLLLKTIAFAHVIVAVLVFMFAFISL